MKRSNECYAVAARCKGKNGVLLISDMSAGVRQVICPLSYSWAHGQTGPRAAGGAERRRQMGAVDTEASIGGPLRDDREHPEVGRIAVETLGPRQIV